MGYWTITELAEQAAAVLARQDRARASDARTRDVPDPRTIRWYQTTGLVDRPSAMRGRTALYGERHLVQLVAIKRLQGEGRSLAAIQSELTGASEDALRERADLPRSSDPTTAGDVIEVPEPVDITDPGDNSRSRFWATTPSDTSSTTVLSKQATPAAARADTTATRRTSVTRRANDETEASVSTFHRVSLAPGVMLLLEGSRTPDAADVEALRRAADPLLAELTSRAFLEEER